MSAHPPAPTEEIVRPTPGCTDPGGPARSRVARSRSPKQSRYYELDLLRFIAAAAVVSFHYFFRAGAQHPVMAHTGFSDPWHVFRYGNLGVELFFMISGFVILNSAWNKPASAFVASRVARLYPAFWVACTVTAVVIALDPNQRFDVSPSKWLGNLTMAPTLIDVGQIDGVYWTLLVELMFYLLVLVLCLVGMSRNRILGAAVGWLAVSIWHGVDPLPGPLATLLEPGWSAFFVAGILFALIARDGWRARYVVPLVAAFGWAEHLAVGYELGQNDRYGGDLASSVVMIIVAVMFVAFAGIASGRLRVPAARWVVVLGALTYPLYLLHQNVGFVLFELGRGRVSRWLLLAAVLAVVVSLAWALHVTVERRVSPAFGRWLRERLARLGAPSSGITPVDEVRARHWPALELSRANSLARII
jgi:peptidoglycan/LPS O-acetylase OafA/YrhL